MHISTKESNLNISTTPATTTAPRTTTMYLQQGKGRKIQEPFCCRGKGGKTNS